MSQKVSSKKDASPVRVPKEVSLNVSRPSGRLLEGTLTFPENETPCGPLVIFLHGTMSTKDHNFVPDLCKKLVKDLGLRSYRFDLRFDKDEFEPDHRYKFSGYNDDIDDLECVVRFLRAEGFAPFCLFGHSRGANDVLLYASTRTLQNNRTAEKLLGSPDHHHRVQSVASVVELANELQEDDDDSKKRTLGGGGGNIHDDAHLLDAEKLIVIAAAPRFNMPRMLTAIFAAEHVTSLEENESFPWESQRGELRVTRDDAKVVTSEMDMGQTVASIPACVPVLLLHGTDDELIPCEDAQAYKDARESIDVTIVDGARHAFRGKKQLKQLLSVCTEWLGEKMKERNIQ